MDRLEFILDVLSNSSIHLDCKLVRLQAYEAIMSFAAVAEIAVGVASLAVGVASLAGERPGVLLTVTLVCY